MSDDDTTDLIAQVSALWSNLDEALDWASQVYAKEADLRWLLADTAAAVMARFGGRGTMGKLAEAWQCSKRHVQYLLDTACAFPPGQRFLDQGWGWHKAVLQAIDSQSRSPLDDQVLTLILVALASVGMTANRVRALGITAARSGRPLLEVLVDEDALPAGVTASCPLDGLACQRAGRLTRGDDDEKTEA